jgi:hypothetical protein
VSTMATPVAAPAPAAAPPVVETSAPVPPPPEVERTPDAPAEEKTAEPATQDEDGGWFDWF